MTRRLGQQFIVEHRPGAGGTIGVAYTAKSKPDGYTVVLVSAGPLGIGPSLYQNPGYDAAKDLVAVARLVELANIVVVPKSSPYRTLQELLQKAKAEPGRVSYGSGGAGTTMHLATVLLGMRARRSSCMFPTRAPRSCRPSTARSSSPSRTSPTRWAPSRAAACARWP